MSTCKLLFLAAILVVLVSVQSQSRDCQRPQNNFENLKHLHEYLQCVKSQTTTRYGKRAYPPILGKLRPDLFTDDYDNMQQFYDVLYSNN